MIGPSTVPIDESADEDDRLLRRWAASADHDALQRLVERLTPAAWAVALRIAGRALAEDAVWAGFARAAQAARSCRGPARAWTLAAVANAARNARRGARRRERGEGRAPVPAPQRDRDALEVAEAAVLVHRALGELPEHERLPIALVHLDGLAVDEAAAALGRGTRTVRSQLRRGLERLRALLAARGVALGVTALAAALAEGRETPPVDAASRLMAFASQAPPPHASARPSWTPIAIGACAAALVIGGMAWAWRADAGGSPGPVRPGAVAGAAADPPVGTGRVDPLDQPVTVRFMRDRLRSALLHLDDRTPGGLAFALPNDDHEPIDDIRQAFGVSWDPPAPSSIRSVLDGLAARTGMAWVHADGVVVFHRVLSDEERQRIRGYGLGHAHGPMTHSRHQEMRRAVAGDLEMRRAGWIDRLAGGMNLPIGWDRDAFNSRDDTPSCWYGIDAALVGDARLAAALRLRVQASPRCMPGRNHDDVLFALAGTLADGTMAAELARRSRSQLPPVARDASGKDAAYQTLAWLVPLARRDDDAADQLASSLTAWSTCAELKAAMRWHPGGPDLIEAVQALADRDTPRRREALRALAMDPDPDWRAAAHAAWSHVAWGRAELRAAASETGGEGALRFLAITGDPASLPAIRAAAVHDAKLLPALARHGTADDLRLIRSRIGDLLESIRPADPDAVIDPESAAETGPSWQDVVHAWCERDDDAGFADLAAALLAGDSDWKRLGLDALILANARSPQGSRALLSILPRLSGTARAAATWAMATSRDEALVASALKGMRDGILPVVDGRDPPWANLPRCYRWWHVSSARVDELVRRASSPDEEQAEAAVHWLGDLAVSAPALDDRLLAIASNAPNGRLRGAAVSRIGSDRHAAQLLRIAFDDPSAFVRSNAWFRLGVVFERSALTAAARQRLAIESDGRVRIHLLLSLRGEWEVLEGALEHDADSRVRSAAAVLYAERAGQDGNDVRRQRRLERAYRTETDAGVRISIGRALAGGEQGTISETGVGRGQCTGYTSSGITVSGHSWSMAVNIPAWSDTWISIDDSNG